MIENLHTHTPRCGHASGAEEAYVLRAIEGGLQTLGFSDHAPFHYPDGFISKVRMLPQQLPEYAECIRQLQAKYAGQIRIPLGLEAEYYPACFRDLQLRMADCGIEYMILGQHWLENEVGTVYIGKPTEDVARLEAYCNQAIDGMQTDCYTYLCHPDVINFVGDEKAYDFHMRRLCREANACNMPLEINLWGMEEGKHYPQDRFWALAAEENCPVLIACDAHRPEVAVNPEKEALALQIVEKYGLQLLHTVPLRKPW